MKVPQHPPQNLNNTTVNNIATKAIKANNVANNARQLLNIANQNLNMSIFEYTLKGNTYTYSIKNEFSFDDNFISSLSAFSKQLSEENIKNIVKQNINNKNDQQYILKNYKPIDEIIKDKSMTYEQFLILSYFLSTSPNIRQKEAQTLIEYGTYQIQTKQKQLQKVGSTIGDISLIIGTISSAITLTKIFWSGMPMAAFYASLAIAISFAVYTLTARLINLYRISKLNKQSDDIKKLNLIAWKMQQALVNKIPNNIINNPEAKQIQPLKEKNIYNSQEINKQNISQFIDNNMIYDGNKPKELTQINNNNISLERNNKNNEKFKTNNDNQENENIEQNYNIEKKSIINDAKKSLSSLNKKNIEK